MIRISLPTISIRRLALLLITTMFVLSNVSQTVSAFDDKFDEAFFNNNYIDYYQPNTCSATDDPISTPPVVAGDGIYAITINDPRGRQYHGSNYDFENSLGGVETARKGNFHSIDLDINISTDGIFFAAHDHALTGKSWSAVESQNSHRKYKISKLSDLLAKTAEYGLQANLDIKKGSKWNDAAFSELANLANSLQAKITVKASTEHKELADALRIAQRHGFWVRSNKNPYAGNGWAAGVWHKPNVVASSSSTSVSTTTAAVTTADATSGSFRMGSYNAAGVTMQKGGLGGLGKAQAHFTDGMAVVDSNNATVVALQELATSVKAPAGWSMYRAPFGQRAVGVAWKTSVWVKVVEKGIFNVDNSKESPNTPNAYKYPYVTLADKDGAVVTVVSAHLVSSLRNASQRPEQARAVKDKVLELASDGRSVVLGGDFNYRKPELFNDMKPLVPANPQSNKIDNIFGIPGTTFSKFKMVENTHSFTDHPLIFTDVSVSGKSFSATPASVDCVCPAADTSSTSATLRGKTGLEKVYNYFIDKGFSPLHAAAIVGNVSQESGGFPMRKQGRPSSEEYKDPSKMTGGWGLIQWTPGSKVLPAKKDAGVDGEIYELLTQLDILWGHLLNKPPITKGSFSIKEFKAITDMKQATDYFEDKIEGAGDPEMSSRYAAARLALDEYGDGSSTGAAAFTAAATIANCADGASGAEAGDAVQTALNYAWPEYHSPNYTKLKPSYATAVKKASAKGKYVGGGELAGVDCGGFVTRVMQDSGTDADYGGGGDTSTQLAYLEKNDKYTELKNPTTKDLGSFAIAIKTSGGGHTYMYVGKQSGFQTQVASASYSPSNTSWRSPMAGKEAPADPQYRWFVLKDNGTVVSV